MASWIEYTAPEWRNLNMRSLNVDEAYIYLDSQLKQKSWMYSLSEDCYTCPFTKLKELHPNSNTTIKVDVARPLTFKVFDRDVGKYAFDNETSLCTMTPYMREFGVYNFTLSENENMTCNFVTDKDGVDIYMSMLTVALIVLLGIALYKVKDLIVKLVGARNQSEDNTHEIQPEKKRMKSLDSFRGLAIVLMIFVNSGGGHYWWIEHATWNGLHLADVVFPSFLWIMGVCIPISVKSQLGRGTSKMNICKKIAWRSIKLFLIGLCLNSSYGPKLEELRIMGVLQRFGIAFFVCGVLHTIFSRRDHILPQGRWQRTFYDIILMKGEFGVIVALIALHLGILFGVAAPGCPQGYLGPGGKHSHVENPLCIGGIVRYVDVSILGNSHMYQHPTAKWVYDSTAFDPEGLFGCILTVVQVLFGVLCGVTIITFPDWKDRIKRWLAWSVFCGLLGGILCLFSQESGPIPLNKNLWSLSFVLVTVALAFLFLSLLYWIIDVRNLWIGSPFVECGKNAIIMYVGHSVLHRMLPWHWRIGAMNTHFVLLLECTWNTILWIIIALYLNSIKYYYSL